MKQDDFIQFLLDVSTGMQVRMTAAGFVMLSPFNLTAKEAARLLKRYSSEVYWDPKLKVNVYIINVSELLNQVVDVLEEGSGIPQSVQS